MALYTAFTSIQLTGDAVYDSSGNQILAGQGAAVSSVAGTVPAGSTGTFGFKTATDRNTAITTILELKTAVNAVLARLRAHGLIDT